MESSTNQAAADLSPLIKESAVVKSARRVLDILEYFAQGTPKATVTQIANALAYPQSSTSALLSSLCSLGFLRQDPKDRTYTPTLRVMLLGSWMQNQLFGQTSLLAVVERLRRRTGQPVMVGLLQGIHVRFILSMSGKSSEFLHYPVGVLRPVCRSAVGKVLLSTKSNAQVAQLARHANAAEEPGNRVSVRQLLQELNTVRDQGWAMSLDYPLPNHAAMAIALPRIEGQPAMAINVGGKKHVVLARKDSLLRELNDACGLLASGCQDVV